MRKKIIIIGAGIAGLSAGCYSLINGYETEIYEMHNIPGGLCTSWKRQGYTFDGCIDFLLGTDPNSMLYRLWDTVGGTNGGDGFIHHDFYMQIEGDAGKKLTLYSDIDKLEKHMLELSPADSELIKELADAIRYFSLIGNGSTNHRTSRLLTISMRDFASEFKDPFLMEALSNFVDLPFFLIIMSAYSKKNAGWPVGGSLAFARNIEKRFLDLGGQIKYRAKVDEILIQDGQASGVRLADGSIHAANLVISAADGHATIFQMLGGRYIDEEIKALYIRDKTYPTSVQVSLGVDFDLSDQPHHLLINLNAPVRIAGVEKNKFLLRHYCADKSLAPAGKSIVTTLMTSSYEYWHGIYQDPAIYKAEKEKIALEFIRVFEERFPEAKGKVEVVDVATPLTYTRYSDAWKGAYMGWLSTPEQPIFTVPSTLPGLKNFYMTGQWTNPRGGLPNALVTARKSVMQICEDDGKKFIERLPASSNRG